MGGYASEAPVQPPSRSSCSCCGRPLAACLCHALPSAPLRNRTRHVIVLTHPAEMKRSLTSTSQLLPQLLERSTTIVGRLFRPGDNAILDAALAQRDTLLLFPRADAFELQAPQGLAGTATAAAAAATPENGSFRERLDEFVTHARAKKIAEERAFVLLPVPPAATGDPAAAAAVRDQRRDLARKRRRLIEQLTQEQLAAVPASSATGDAESRSEQRFLVVLDGTWREVRRLLNQNERLKVRYLYIKMLTLHRN